MIPKNILTQAQGGFYNFWTKATFWDMPFLNLQIIVMYSFNICEQMPNRPRPLWCWKWRWRGWACSLDQTWGTCKRLTTHQQQNRQNQRNESCRHSLTSFSFLFSRHSQLEKYTNFNTSVGLGLAGWLSPGLRPGEASHYFVVSI